MSNNIQTIKTALAAGETEEALEQILQLTANADKASADSGILLMAAWRNQKQQAINGLLSFEEANLQRNRIIKGALDVLSNIEQGNNVSAPVEAGLKKDLFNYETATIIHQMTGGSIIQGEQVTANVQQTFESTQVQGTNTQSAMQGATIQAADDGNVIIGQGNTVHQKKVTGFGWRQFFTILLVLGLLGGGGYYAYTLLDENSDREADSLDGIMAEMRKMALTDKEFRTKWEENETQVADWVSEANDAYKAGDFKKSNALLEKINEVHPTVAANLLRSDNYLKLGDDSKSYEAQSDAMKIDKTITRSFEQLKGRKINLLAGINGGKVLVGDDADNAKMTDSDLNSSTWGDETVFSFKDKKRATFDMFKFYIDKTSDYNPSELELSYSNDSPTGIFIPIKKIKPLNAKLSETPFQEFRFPAVTAKYFKLKNISGKIAFITEVELIGTLKDY